MFYKIWRDKNLSRGKYSLKKRDMHIAYGMLAPTFILLTVFAVIPLLITLGMSFTDSGYYRGIEFVGIDNYRRVLMDDRFFDSLIAGLKLVLYVIPIQIVLSFLFAHIIKNMPLKLAGFVKTSIFVPVVISGVIAAAIFSYVYEYQAGLLNFIIGKFGFENQAWLASAEYVFPAIALPMIWLGFGYTTLLLLAGLLDIPQSYYEAAVLDGANGLQKMIYITIPLMKNILLFVLISRFIQVVQEYDIPFQMTRGGPANMTLTPVLHLYNHFSRDVSNGYTLAGAIILALIIGSVSGLFFKVINSQKEMHM